MGYFCQAPLEPCRRVPLYPLDTRHGCDSNSLDILCTALPLGCTWVSCVVSWPPLRASRGVSLHAAETAKGPVPQGAPAVLPSPMLRRRMTPCCRPRRRAAAAREGCGRSHARGGTSPQPLGGTPAG